MPRIELPDGRLLDVPEGVSLEEVRRKMIQTHPEWFSEQSIGSQVGDFLASVTKGGTTETFGGAIAGIGHTGEAIGSKVGLSDNAPGNDLTEIGENIRSAGDDLFNIDPRFESSFAGQVASGIGQMGSFMVQGLVNPVLPFVTGGLQMSTEGAEDAIRSGATPEQTYNSILWNAALGTTEALPVVHLLNRLPKPAKSRILKAFREGGIQGLEEAMQETAQQGGLNWFAQMTYDQQREITEGLGNAAGVGGTVGAITGSVLGFLIPGKQGARIDTSPEAPATGTGVDPTTQTTVGEQEETTTEAPVESTVTNAQTLRQAWEAEGIAPETVDAQMKIMQAFASHQGMDLDTFISSSIARSEGAKAGTLTEPAQETLAQIVGLNILTPQSMADKPQAEEARRTYGFAVDMIAQGKSNEEVFEETGWYQGADGLIRYEVDDSTATVNSTIAQYLLQNYDSRVRLEKLIGHETLPQLWINPDGATSPASLRIGIDVNMSEEQAAYVEGLDQIGDPVAEILVSAAAMESLKDKGSKGWGFAVVMHELQHAIQSVEGFTRGGGTEQFDPGELMKLNMILSDVISGNKPAQGPLVGMSKKDMQKILDGAEKAFNFVLDNGKLVPEKHGGLAPNSTPSQILRNLIDMRTQILYHSIRGEIEANQTAARSRMSKAERMTTFPKNTNIEGLDYFVDIFPFANIDKVIASIDPDQMVEAYKKLGPGKVLSFDTAQHAWAVMTEAEMDKKRFYQDKKGSIEFLEDGKAVIRLFENADASTLIHESAHLFRRWLNLDEIAIANKFVGAKTGEWSVAQEEKWARAFERYLRRNRKSKMPGLDAVFEKMKTLLRQIYKVVKGSPIDVELTPEIISLFDKILTPAAVPTRTPPHELTYDEWVKVVGEDLVAIEGVPDALAVARPKKPSMFLHKLNGVMKGTRWTPVIAKAKDGTQIRPLDAAVAEVSDPKYNQVDNSVVQVLRNIRKAYVLAQKAFLDEADLTPFSEVGKMLEDQALRSQDQGAIQEARLAKTFINSLLELQQVQASWNVPARQKLLELREKYKQDFVMDRTDGSIWMVEKVGKYDYALSEFDGNAVRKASRDGFFSNYVLPEMIDVNKEWTITKDEWLRDKHYEMITQAIQNDQEVPAHALKEHINRDPILNQLYLRALQEEKASEEQQAAKEYAQVLHQAAEETEVPENIQPVDTVNDGKINEQKVGQDVKVDAKKLGEIINQTKDNLKKLQNALRHETQVELTYIIDKGMVQRETNLEGPVGDNTYAMMFADMMNTLDDIQGLMETRLEEISETDDFGRAAERVARMFRATNDWVSAVENARPGMLETEPETSIVNKIYEFGNRMIGKTPSPESSVAWTLRKSTMTMQWIANRFPIAKKLWEAGAIDRLNNANMQSSILMNGSDAPEIVMGFGANHTIVEKSIQAPGISAVANFPRQGPMYVALQRILLASDQFKVRFTSPESIKELLDKVTEGTMVLRINDKDYNMDFSTQELAQLYKAYDQFQGTFDYIYDKLVNKLISQFGPERATKMAKTLFPNGKQPGYFPHMRLGRWKVVVKKDGEVIESVSYENPWDQTKAIKILKAKYGSDHWVGPPPIEERMRESVGPEDVLTAVREVVSKAELEVTPDTRREIEDAMDKAAMQIFKHHGLYTSLQERKNTPGFDERVINVLYKRIEDFSAGIAKVEFAQQGLEGLSALRHHANLYNYAHEWYSQMLSSATVQDQWIGKIRALIFLRYLGFNIKTGFVVFADKLTNAPAQLGLYTKNADSKIIKALPETVKFKTWYSRVEKVMKEEGIPRARAIERVGMPDFINDARWSELDKQRATYAMLRAWDIGATKAKFTPETLGQEETTWEKSTEASAMTWVGKYLPYASKSLSKLFDHSAFFVRNAEELNRMSTFLAAYKVFTKEKGYDFDRAVRQSHNVVNDAHFMYGKPNVPLLLNRSGGKFFKIPYIFRAFEHNYIQMLQNLMFSHGKRGKIMALKSLTYLIGLAGAPSIPFFLPMAKTAGLFVDGDDPEEMMRRAVNQIDSSETLSTLFSDGLPGLADISIRSSLQVGAYDTFNEAFFGVAGSAARDAIDLAGFAYAGNWPEFGKKFIPTAAANIIKAGEGSQSGVLSRHGTPLRENVIGRQIKYGPYESATKLLGFQPIREARAYRLKRAVTNEANHWQDRRSRIYARIAKAVRQNNKGQLAQAIEDIRQYEIDRRANKAYDIPSITRQGLRQSLSEAQLRKREVLRVLRMTGQLL